MAPDSDFVDSGLVPGQTARSQREPHNQDTSVTLFRAKRLPLPNDRVVQRFSALPKLLRTCALSLGAARVHLDDLASWLHPCNNSQSPPGTCGKQSVVGSRRFPLRTGALLEPPARLHAVSQIGQEHEGLMPTRKVRLRMMKMNTDSEVTQ